MDGPLGPPIREEATDETRGLEKMADPLNRLENNQPGKYYVDESCTNCASCFFTAGTMREMLQEAGLRIEYQEPVISISPRRSVKKFWKLMNRILSGRLTPFLAVQWLWRCKRT